MKDNGYFKPGDIVTATVACTGITQGNDYQIKEVYGNPVAHIEVWDDRGFPNAILEPYQWRKKAIPEDVVFDVPPQLIEDDMYRALERLFMKIQMRKETEERSNEVEDKEHVKVELELEEGKPVAFHLDEYVYGIVGDYLVVIKEVK